VNKSSVPVEFSWRAFATEREEKDKKMRLVAELAKEEAEERMILEESNPDESQAESLDSDDSYDEDELNKKADRAQQKAISTLSRKYQSICKAVEEDQMLFQDEIFSIEPLQGKIWPNTEITCCVTFKP
jgi:hydrocephalus-inducing protein